MAEPDRMIRVSMMCGPTHAGAISWTLIERTVRRASSSEATTARTSAATTSPPQAPRPCCQPSGTIHEKVPDPVGWMAEAASNGVVFTARQALASWPPLPEVASDVSTDPPLPSADFLSHWSHGMFHSPPAPFQDWTVVPPVFS